MSKSGTKWPKGFDPEDKGMYKIEPKAKLKGAYLSFTDLEGADLEGADLRLAYLKGVNLRGADLEGADLSNVDLKEVNLSGVIYDDETKWPKGYDKSRLTKSTPTATAINK
jgi:hypothetical protein